MKLASTLIATGLLLAGCATGPGGSDHSAHHPPGPGAATASSAAPAAAPCPMDGMMASMHESHARVLAAAKTPEERERLMQEHMKLMKEHQAMRGQMHGGAGHQGGGAMGAKMAGPCAEMMKSMKEREAPQPPPAAR